MNTHTLGSRYSRIWIDKKIEHIFLYILLYLLVLGRAINANDEKCFFFYSAKSFRASSIAHVQLSKVFWDTKSELEQDVTSRGFILS